MRSVTWTELAPEDDGVVAEWVREDGWATIRIRRGRDAWVVRFDRLTQAPEGSAYREERVARRADAESVAAEWRETHAVD